MFDDGPTDTTLPSAGSTTFNPAPSSNFPGGALIAQFVNYVLYAAIAAAVIAVIAGAGTLAYTSRGNGSMGTHQWGIRMLIGGIGGLVVLGSITAIV